MDDAFLDVRAHGYRRVAVCVPEVRVGDPAFNAEAHLRSLQQAYDAGAHYALCPELGLTGYTAGDLFFQEVLLRGAVDAVERVAAATADWNMIVSVGAPLVVDGGLYNCAVTLYGGRAVAVVPKSYPPNYREFYELRWFRPAAGAAVDRIELIGASVPFGSDVLVGVNEWRGFLLHTDICEDLWVPVPPGTIAALAGATVLGNLSASNVTVAKFEYRRELVRSSAAKNLAVQVYGAAGFGESTSDLAWDGHGLIADRGDIAAETERFVMGGTLAVADVDLDALVTDRARQTSWGQNAADHRRPMRAVMLSEIEEARPVDAYRRFERYIEPHPYVPPDTAQLDERCHEVFSILATSLARRVLALPEGARRIVLGVSGGRDSTLALIVAIRALELAGLPRTHLVGISMPGFGTTDRTAAIARDLIAAFGATAREIDVRPASSLIYEAVGHDPAVEDTTFENVQAWSRKFMLFATASQVGGIDLGTGDLSEIALGWSTYGADHMSHYAINAGVPKTLISRLIRWSADTVYGDEPAVREVLERVLDTPISPELTRPSAEGEVAQLSEELIGPYELHDFFLYHFSRFGFGPRRIARMALHAFGDRYTIGEIRQWLIVFLQRFFANQFKRDAVPDSPKVGSGGALSPRGDWRMPSDGSVAAWVTEAEAIPGE